MSGNLLNFTINNQYVNTLYTITLPTGISNSPYTITSSNTTIAEIIDNNTLHSKSVGACTITFTQDTYLIEASLNVVILPLNVSIASNSTITYGDNLPTFSCSVVPIPTGLTIYDNTLFNNLIQNITFNITNTDGTTILDTTKLNVGDYYVVPTYETTDNTNYSYTTVRGSLAVQQSQITLTANDKSTIYGTLLDTTASYSLTSGSLASGETITSVTRTYKSNTYDSTTVPTNVSSYSIIISNAVGTGGFNGSNYNINYTSGILTITKATLIINETNLSVTPKIYDGTRDASVSGAIITGLKNGETLSFTQSGTFSDANASLSLITVTISYSITDATGSISNYELNKTTSSWSGYINPKPVKLSATKIYDGTTNLVEYVTINTGITGETLTYSGATVNDKNVITINKYITSIILQNGTGQASNYTTPDLTKYDIQNNNVTIQEKTVRLSATKIYDATTDLTGYVTITTGITDETLTYSSATVNDKNVATLNKYITSINLQNSTGTASNYTFNNQYDSTYNSVIINTVLLTINETNLSVLTKTYNGSTDASVSGSVLVGLINPETLNFIQSGTFLDPNASSNLITVTVLYSISDGSNGTGLASNYQLNKTSSSTNGIINKATLTVTANPQTMYYGDSIPTLTQKITGFINNEPSSVVSGIAYATVTATSSSVVGSSYTITAVNTGLSALNYNFDILVNGTLTINKRPITLKADNRITTYGTSFDLGTAFYLITSGGLASGDSITSVTLQYNGNQIVPSTTPYNQNGYIINISNASGTGNFSISNYDIIYVAGSLAINKAPLTIIDTITASNKVYDRTATATLSGGTLNGLMNNETLTLTPGGSFLDSSVANSKTISFSYSIGDGTGANAGFAMNYSLTQPTQALTADITKATLTVTANPQTIYYGDSIPILTQTITGFINGDILSVVSGTAYATVTATSSSVVGSSYTITAVNTGLSALNYNFNTLVDNTLTINKRPITLKADNRITTYGTSFDLGTTLYAITSGGLASGDSITSVTLQYNGNQIVPSKTPYNQNGYTINISNAIGTGQFTASNYNISYVAGLLTINKAPLTIIGTISASDKVYDGTNTASLSGGTLNGLMNNETLTLTPGGSFPDSNVGDPKTITILYGISKDSGDTGLVSNYSLTQPIQALTANIRRKDLIVDSTKVDNKIYNGTSKATVHSSTLNGLVGSETLNLIQSASFSSPNVGNSIPVTVTNSITDKTGLASNYNLTNPTISSLVAYISQKMVTLSATKIYDSTTNLTGKVTITTGVPNETLNYENASANDANVVYPNNFIKTITLTNGTNNGIASNYSLPDLTLKNVNNTVTISKVDLTVINTTPPTKNYDGTNNASINGGQLSGIQINDQITLKQSGTYDTIDVGTNIKINMNNSVTCINRNTLADVSSNYNFIQPTVIGSIIPKTVTLSATKAYDATNNLTGKVTITTGITGETLSYSGATVNDKNVITSNKYINYIILIDSNGGKASNYTFNNQYNITNNSVTITPISIGVSGTTIYDKIYNGILTATINNAGQLSTLVNSETLTLTQSASFLSADVGNSINVTVTNSITNKTGIATNYLLTDTTQTLTANISKASLTVNVISTIVDQKFYDGTSTANVHGGTLDGLIGSENFNLTQTGVFSAINVNTLIPVTVTNVISIINGNNGKISNYNLTNPTISSLVANINKKIVTLSATKIYDSTTNLTGKVTITTGVLNETLNYTNASANDANVAYSNNFIKTITLTDGTNNGVASNYSLPNLTSRNTNNTATINKANLYIISQDASKNYGDDNPSYTFTYNLNNFFGSDTSTNSGITGSPSYTVNDSNGNPVSKSTPVGQYTIQILYNTLSSPNYSFLSTSTGKLTINKINYDFNWLQQYSPPTCYKVILTDLLLKAVSKDIITNVDVGNISYYTYDSTGNEITLTPNSSYLPYDGTFVIYARITVTNPNYITTPRTITKNLTIVKSRLDLTWYNPVPISSTIGLSATQLNAVCNNSDAIAKYNKNIGDKLPEGLNTLNVTFKTDDPNYVYNSISTIVPINII